MNPGCKNSLPGIFEIALLLFVAVPGSPAQSNLAPTSTTLTSDSPTLFLPGSLTLTSTVSSNPSAPGVPRGAISFYYDGNQANNLGGAPLSILPATHKFIQTAPFPLTAATPTTMVGAPLNSANSYLDIVVDVLGGNGPAFVLYPGLGNGQIDIASPQTYPIGTLGMYDTIDSMVVGSFSAVGSVDVVAHTNQRQSGGMYASTYSLLSKQAGGPLAAKASVKFDPAPGIADNEEIVTDDFNGDGLSDIAYVVKGSHFGVSLNSLTTPGTLTAPNALYAAGSLCPVSLATGKFTTSGHADLIIGATQCGATSPTAGYLLLFPGDSTGGFGQTTQGTPGLTVAPATQVLVGTDPVAIAAGDFNKDGKLDVVVADGSGSTIHVIYGKGDGTFQPTIATYSTVGNPTGITVGDFNGDGYPDIAVMLSSNGSVAVLYNDGTGAFVVPSQTFSTTTWPLAVLSGDFNSDGYPDIAFLTGLGDTVPLIEPAANMLLGTGSAQSVLVTAPLLIPVGSHTLTAAFPGDTNLVASTSAGVQVSAAVPTLASVSPTMAKLGDPNTIITVVGQGFLAGASVLWNGTPLATSFVDGGHLTAVIPSSLLQTVGIASITVVDPHAFPVTGTQTFTVIAPSAVVSATGPSTISVTQQSLINLSISPYPVPVTATATLSFAPAAPNTIFDPTVLFSNGTTTFTVDIPALDTAIIPPINFQSGSSAGTITITVRLTAGGADITPASLPPLAVVVPAAPPAINTVALTRSGTTLQLAITGLSSTREITQAQFHFVPAPGQSLTTTDVTVPLTTVFSAWYQSEVSTAFGTQFLYTQPFTLNADAGVVGSVTVILTNSQGASAPSNAQ